MPGHLHDGVVTLLEQRPALLLEVWRRCGGPSDLQGWSATVLVNELRTSFGGQGVRHIRPDLLVCFAPLRGPARYASIEVIATEDARRIDSWQVSTVLIRQRFRDPDPIQILIPLGREVRQWLVGQIRQNPGIAKSRLLDARRTPISDPHEAALEIALLRADAPLEACEHAIRQLRQHDDPFTDDYESLILHAVPRPQMEMLRMSLRDLEVEIDDADRQGYFYSVAFEEGERAGRARGEEEGHRRGQEEGHRRGEEEGHRRGQIETIVAILEGRRMTPTPELLACLHGCSLAQLRRAVVLALEIHSIVALEQTLRE